MLSSAVSAQAPLPVRPAGIVPYEATWRVVATRPDGTSLPQGLWTDAVTQTQYNGRSAIRRVQGVTYVNGASMTWVNVLDAKTLRPLMDTQRGRKGIVTTRTFGDDAVTTTHGTLDGRTLDSARTPLAGVTYDYLAGTYGLLLATLPLADGYHARFLSVDAQGDSVKTVDVKVTGRDRASAGHGRLVDVWKVVDGQVTYFIGTEAPFILKIVEQLPDGGMMT